MLTIPTTPEQEQSLEIEAQKHGLSAEQFALRLLEDFLPSGETSDPAEAARLVAIDELMGIGVGKGFSTEDLHRERREEVEREEAQYQQMFCKDKAR